MSNPTILTVILNFRTPELTLKATGAAVREMAGLEGEIIIVDNSSGDGSFEIISKAVAKNGWQKDSLVRVIQSGRNGGFGAGNNIAIHAGLSDGSKPDFVYILNSDAWTDPGAIRILRDFLISSPITGVAGGYVQGVDGEPHRTAFRFPSIGGEFEATARTGFISRLLANKIVARPIPTQNTQADWLAGASLMMRRAMLDEIGLFDETFFLYFEETDLCRRAAKAGWRTYYIPESVVTHIGSASTGMKTWPRTPNYWFDSRLHYFTKNHGPLYAFLATMAHISGSLVWRLRRLISDKPQCDPDWFLRDLAAHSCKAIFRGQRSKSIAPVKGNLVEDSE